MGLKRVGPWKVLAGDPFEKILARGPTGFLKAIHFHILKGGGKTFFSSGGCLENHLVVFFKKGLNKIN